MTQAPAARPVVVVGITGASGACYGVRVGSLSKLGAKRAGEAAAAGSPHDTAPLF